MGRMTGKILRVEDLRTETLTGTVVGCQTWSETRVHGGAKAGSTYVPAGGGHVSTPAVTVSSTTTEKLQLFIRRDDGREFDQRFVHAGVGIREGNRISIVYAPEIGGEPMALVNHDTGKSCIYDNRIQQFVTTTYASPGQKTANNILSLVNLIGFVALLYFSISGDLSWDDILACTVLLMASIFVAIWLGPKVPSGLWDGIKAAIQQRVDDALNAEKMRAS